MGNTKEISLQEQLYKVEERVVESGAGVRGKNQWTKVRLGWNDIYPRTNPGEMRSYSAPITATSDTMTLFIRAWKKWPVGWGELDVDLDSISLTGYTAP